MTLTDRPEDADAVILNTAIREHAELRVLERLGEFAPAQAEQAVARGGGGRLHGAAPARVLLDDARA
jgi:tRNA A37 methylthiotransferase MiaB